jgi:SAM-dependent methyltransferase
MAGTSHGMVAERVGSLADVQRRELEFHDALSSPMLAANMPPREPDRLERELLLRAGDLAGLRVLELGCGTGDLTLQLLGRGADVTALDLSAGMVNIAQERAERFAPLGNARFVVAPVERSGLSSESFDLALGKWILHHSEIRAAATEIHRVLRGGGRGLFAENSGLNPLLMFSRRHLAGRWGIPRYGTEDEHPLSQSDYEMFGRVFASSRLHFPDFCFFQLFDRQIFKFRRPLLTKCLRGFDEVAATQHWLRRYSYHVVIELTR